MVRVFREVNIKFNIINTGGGSASQVLTGVRNFVTNTLLPGMTTRFNNNFSAFPTRTADAVTTANEAVTRIGTTTPFEYEINMLFGFSVDATADDAADVRIAWGNFVDDCRDGLRTAIQNRPNTTLKEIHCHQADGTLLVITF